MLCHSMIKHLPGSQFKIFYLVCFVESDCIYNVWMQLWEDIRGGKFSYNRFNCVKNTVI